MQVIIKNMIKSYNEYDKILNDITLNVDNVSSIGIIGQSGCGKSTLLRQLAGIENPDSGEILINNISPIDQKKLFQDEIGVVFQQHNLFPHLTIQKNITLILEKIKGYSKSKANQRSYDILHQLHLEKQLTKLPSQISGGQAQRAAIARALATNPKLLFLDEPTAALDPLLSKEVLHAVKNLKSKDIEFIFVTHEISFLREFADYIIFMNHGKIVEHGLVSCLMKPKTKELKHFLEGDKNEHTRNL